MSTSTARRVRRTRRTCSDEPDTLDDRELPFQPDRLPQAKAFATRYPNPEALLRDTMNQNETSGAPSQATANAVTAAFAGVRHNIAAAVQ